MADAHSSDVTGANIDGAENVVVGKANRQQSGGRGDQNVTINSHDEPEPNRLGLIYDLVLRIESNLEREGREWRAAFGGLRNDIGEVSRVAHETKAKVDENLAQAVTLNQNHRRAFAAGFVLLTVPVPLYFDGFLRGIDLNWPLALVLALSCYAISAGFWHYMWWGNR